VFIVILKQIKSSVHYDWSIINYVFSLSFDMIQFVRPYFGIKYYYFAVNHNIIDTLYVVGTCSVPISDIYVIEKRGHRRRRAQDVHFSKSGTGRATGAIRAFRNIRPVAAAARVWLEVDGTATRLRGLKSKRSVPSGPREMHWNVHSERYYTVRETVVLKYKIRILLNE